MNAQDRKMATDVKNNVQAMADLETYMSNFGKGLVARDHEKIRIYMLIQSINRGE